MNTYSIFDTLSMYQKTGAVGNYLFKGFRLHMNIYSLKYNLIRLAQFSDSNRLQFYEPLELYAWRMNNNTPEQKTQIMGWVSAGMIAQNAAKYARQLLHRFKIHNVYPNLTGLHFRYPTRVLGTNISGSFYPTGQAITTAMFQNNLTLRYYRRQASESIDTSYRITKNSRIIYSRIRYNRYDINKIGIDHFERNFHFRLHFSMNVAEQQSKRIDFLLWWVL